MATQKKVSKATTRSADARAQRVERIPIDQLLFDPVNPRLGDILSARPSQPQIQEVLLSLMEARELVPSFIKNGYLPYEPLIVRPERSGAFVVLEGNRRLAALKSMRDSQNPEEQKAFAVHHLGMPPCLIFEGRQTEELAYLGLRHLSKTKDWSAAAKAAFVERMLKSGMSLAEAGKMTNTQRNALRQMLLVRRLFERAGKLGIELHDAKAEGEITFWHLGDAVRRSNTQKYLQLEENENPLEQPTLDEGRFENLLTWLYGSDKTRQARVIMTIRDIPNLDKCLGHPRSIEALEAGSSLSDALDRQIAAGVKVSSALIRAKEFVQKATGGVSDIDAPGISEVRETSESVGEALDSFNVTLHSREATLKAKSGEK